MTRYFSFYGTAKRQEYWAVFFIGIAIMFLGTMLSEPLLLLAIILAVAWLKLATAVRRCRDAGISPWWVILFIIPWINVILTIVLGVIRSDNTREVTYV